MAFFGKPAEPKDVELQNLQPDSISALSWSPAADLLAVASWNNEVRSARARELAQHEDG